MTDQNFLQCERLVMLYGSNPQMETKSKSYSIYWLDIICDRSELSSTEVHLWIMENKRPTVHLGKIEYPRNQAEEQAIKWFESLSPEARLKQIQYRFEDWSKEQQQGLAMAGAYE